MNHKSRIEVRWSDREDCYIATHKPLEGQKAIRRPGTGPGRSAAVGAFLRSSGLSWSDIEALADDCDCCGAEAESKLYRGQGTQGGDVWLCRFCRKLWNRSQVEVQTIMIGFNILLDTVGARLNQIEAKLDSVLENQRGER